MFVCATDNTNSCGQIGMKFSRLVLNGIPYQRLNFGLQIPKERGLREGVKFSVGNSTWGNVTPEPPNLAPHATSPTPKGLSPTTLSQAQYL